MRVLLVKISSMGDVIHNLPVVNDILRAHPAARIDWIVEEAYAGLLGLHPGLGQVIPIALRRWRKAPLSATTRAEASALWRRLRASEYDLVIDSQGNVKSALVARAVRGEHVGYARESAREPMAALFYDRRFANGPYFSQPATRRYRALAGWALGYTPEGAPGYGLAPRPLRPDWLPGDAPFVIALTATARDEKLWPEARWHELLARQVAADRCVGLAWGNAAERERATRIAAGIDGAVVAPRALGLVEWAGVLAGASCVVGVDTGLSFLAAAVGAPVVAIYVATSPTHVGIVADTPHRCLGDEGRPPAVDEVLGAVQELARA
ncbi:lipopolysaccharide heptosyltransferase I [Derxia gummosa]|uniref:Lipopolysaccharide heptosyltransferase 1 n=1 Tax=Derxia gummosa DSM 723 TaxID=1121388 RepID=A0A8B6X751_9BURK|nr:lipopolysaccharide heptosyltransferase I [Derxia gummosa]